MQYSTSILLPVQTPCGMQWCGTKNPLLVFWPPLVIPGDINTSFAARQSLFLGLNKSTSAGIIHTVTGIAVSLIGACA